MPRFMALWSYHRPPRKLRHPITQTLCEDKGHQARETYHWARHRTTSPRIVTAVWVWGKPSFSLSIAWLWLDEAGLGLSLCILVPSQFRTLHTNRWKMQMICCGPQFPHALVKCLYLWFPTLERHKNATASHCPPLFVSHWGLRKWSYFCTLLHLCCL